MSNTRFITTTFIMAAILMPADALNGQVTKEQAEQIEAAIPAKASAAPKKNRRVFIWNTPFMDESPHKGYSIPQAEYAMRLLGEKTGAFEPVVSDDVAMSSLRDKPPCRLNDRRWGESPPEPFGIRKPRNLIESS